MKVPDYGGKWTQRKLHALRQYLPAYLKIVKAKRLKGYFTATYIDAFAGCGEYESHTDATKGPVLFSEFRESETQEFLKGSARIALEVDPPFDKYIFLEKRQKYVRQLESLLSETGRNGEVVDTDANPWLQDYCRVTDWSCNRSVVFLDPYGMQVEWPTLKALAATQAVDLWWLFPLGMGVIRLLDRDKMPTGKAEQRLNTTFGTDDWRGAFYKRRRLKTLFGEEEADIRTADLSSIKEFALARLKTVFPHVAPRPLVLKNSRNVPLYLLCFAAANPKGGETAIKIAQHLLKE